MSGYNENVPQKPWVPYEQRGTAYWIFEELFVCQIPYIQMLDLEELQEYGMPTSGDASYDYGTANEMRQIMIPISEMVKYYAKGVQVYVVDPADTKRIYERISDHLIAWKEKLSKSLNMSGAPLEDLKLMDQFANAVYEHAKYQFTDDTISSLLSRQVDPRHHDLNRLIANIEGPILTAEEVQKQEEEEKYPQRESLADFFQPYRNAKPLAKKTVSNGPGMNAGRGGMSDFIGGVPKYD